MEAIILAGGFGTRLRKTISNVPKSMAPVSNRPFLEILLSLIARKGFTRVILSTGYMASTISCHFGNKFGELDLCYAVEENALGTGGATRLALSKSTQDHVFIFNGDTYLDLEVNLIENKWRSLQQPIVVARYVDDTSRFGSLLLNNGKVNSFNEKGSSGPGFINAGCYVLPREILDHFPLYHHFALEADFLSPQASKGKINYFVTDGLFIDIGIPEDYQRAQTLLSKL